MSVFDSTSRVFHGSTSARQPSASTVVSPPPVFGRRSFSATAVSGVLQNEEETRHVVVFAPSRCSSVRTLPAVHVGRPSSQIE